MNVAHFQLNITKVTIHLFIYSYVTEIEMYVTETQRSFASVLQNKFDQNRHFFFVLFKIALTWKVMLHTQNLKRYDKYEIQMN